MKLGRYCADVHCYSPHANYYFWNAVVCRCNRSEVQCCHCQDYASFVSFIFHRTSVSFIIRYVH